MKTLFLILRLITGMMAVGALVILFAIVFLRSAAAFAKEGVGVLGYVATLFTSGFTKGTAPRDPAGWVVAMPQVCLAVLFAAMLVSTFLPGTKILFHVVGVLAGVALIWYLRMMQTGAKLEILCLPLVAVWFLYYAMSVFWSGNQSVPVVTGS
jgi:hypothetical protein